MNMMKSALRGLVACSLIACVALPMLSGGSSTLAQTASTSEMPATIWKKTSIASLIQAYADTKGCTVVIPDEYSSTITSEHESLITTFEGAGSEVSTESRLRLALSMRKLALVRVGETDTIMGLSEALPNARTVRAEELKDIHPLEIVALPIKLSYLDANQLRSALVNLSTRGGSSVNPIGHDAVMMVDTAYRIGETMKLINALDQLGNGAETPTDSFENGR